MWLRKIYYIFKPIYLSNNNSSYFMYLPLTMYTYTSIENKYINLNNRYIWRVKFLSACGLLISLE